MAEGVQHGDLVFWRERTESGDLVFGLAPEPEQPDAPHAEFRVSIALPFMVRGTTYYDSNVDRTCIGIVRQHAQPAQPMGAATRSAWQQSRALGAGQRQHAQPAQPTGATIRAHWQDTQRLAGVVRQHAQPAQPVGTGTRARYQQTIALRASVLQRLQAALPIGLGTRARYQQVIVLRAGVRSRMQPGLPLGMFWRRRFANGLPILLAYRQHMQPGRYPVNHHHPVVPEQPDRDLCYCPDTLGQLVFRAPYTGDGQLLFVCRPCVETPPGPDPEPPAHIIIARRRSYIVINSIELRRADDLSGPPLPSEAFYMTLDAGSWTWTWEATFHRDARAAVTPAAGETIEIEARVNGQPFRLQIERSGRSARFPERLVTASGRGRAAVLDAPHSPVQSFGNDSQRTAQQLMEEVLTINGVGFGWSVDFQLTDWIVPGGVWGHHGTFASALSEIAAAAGGYLQPHDTDNVLHVLPRWPLPWWRWADEAEPDIELPVGFAEMEATELIDKPEANRIILHGHAGGVQGDYKREGSAGDILREPMVTHPLITDASVAYQRAIAELADTGRIINQTLTTMVLPETGIIKPGTMLRYVDDDDVARLGLVRSTAINWQFPVLTQTIGIESHA